MERGFIKSKIKAEKNKEFIGLYEFEVDFAIPRTVNIKTARLTLGEKPVISAYNQSRIRMIKRAFFLEINLEKNEKIKTKRA